MWRVDNHISSYGFKPFRLKNIDLHSFIHRFCAMPGTSGQTTKKTIMAKSLDKTAEQLGNILLFSGRHLATAEDVTYKFWSG